MGFQTRPSENVTLFTPTATVPAASPGMPYDTVYSDRGTNDAFVSEHCALCALPVLASTLLQVNSSRRIGSRPMVRKVTLIEFGSPEPLSNSTGQALGESIGGAVSTSKSAKESEFNMGSILSRVDVATDWLPLRPVV